MPMGPSSKWREAFFQLIRAFHQATSVNVQREHPCSSQIFMDFCWSRRHSEATVESALERPNSNPLSADPF